MQKLLSSIADDCGISINLHERVHGGDINTCYRLQGRDSRYFLKLNNNTAGLQGMFAMEADGLHALRHNSSLLVPAVIKHGVIQDQQWLLLEWMEKGTPQKSKLQQFARGLASLHQQPQSYFGWHSNNYIGSLQQLNTKHGSWADFYTACRIMPLFKTLHEAGAFTKSDIAAAESFCKNIADLFPPEPPALLHGDLWSGNYMITTSGHAAIFDPAVYFGHREMDLGMTALFGGFDNAFYEAYHAVYPLQTGWQQRLPFSQLYPLLVHAVLFGGHYVQDARAIVMRF
ncbi:MAG: fructosamine kinase family protein [Chitinophagaceae bacterium]